MRAPNNSLRRSASREFRRPNAIGSARICTRARTAPRTRKKPSKRYVRFATRQFPSPPDSRAGAESALGGVRGFLGFWNRQRSLCLALVPVVRRTHRNPQAGLGTGLWIVVDDSRAVRPDCFVDGESAPGRRTGLGAAKQVTGTSGER